MNLQSSPVSIPLGDLDLAAAGRTCHRTASSWTAMMVLMEILSD